MADQFPEATTMHEIIVGNIGCVYYGPDAAEAEKHFEEYRDQSERNYGRAAGENVTWFENNEIRQEYRGTLEENHNGIV